MELKKKIYVEYEIADLSNSERFSIVETEDEAMALKILDKKNNQIIFKDPVEIIFSDEYKNYSKEDNLRIGFICGQMSINK